MKKIAKAKLFEIIQIWKIRKIASNHLKLKNVDQWQLKDPSFCAFLKDIIFKRLYVLKEEKEILGVMMLHTKEDTYNEIEGSWSKDSDFIVVHKLAVKETNKGYGKLLLKYVEEIAKLNKINYIRIDTHEANENMKNLLVKLNYKYRGIIYLTIKKGENKRIAYDKEVE